MMVVYIHDFNVWYFPGAQTEGEFTLLVIQCLELARHPHFCTYSQFFVLYIDWSFTPWHQPKNPWSWWCLKQYRILLSGPQQQLGVNLFPSTIVSLHTVQCVFSMFSVCPLWVHSPWRLNIGWEAIIGMLKLSSFGCFCVPLCLQKIDLYELTSHDLILDGKQWRTLQAWCRLCVHA